MERGEMVQRVMRRHGYRPYRCEQVRALAHLLRDRWPGWWTAGGEAFDLDYFEAKQVRVLVWVAGVTVDPPALTRNGWRLVMVHEDFDPEVTVRVIRKRMRQQALSLL